MTMHEEWTDRLSDYLDGELGPDEAAAVEAHLRGCAACSDVLNDLKRIVARAGAAATTARPPDADLWAGIAKHIDGPARLVAPAPAAQTRAPFERKVARPITVTMPQLAAAALVVAAVSGGIGWQLSGRGIGAPKAVPYARTSDSGSGANAGPDGGAASTAPDGSGASGDHRFAGAGSDVGIDARIETVGLADAQYDAAVVDLEKALKVGRGRLDASTIAIVEHNLEIIDQAINQAREALVGDPANTYLSSHLVEARRRKLDLLRRAAALTTDMD